MKASVFYSWQSDLSSKTNRTYLEGIITKSLKTVNKDNRIIACIDRDTKDELGSPSIQSSVFSKINHCKYFICDVSFCGNNCPNPNVLIELGYAIKMLGWNKIVCFFNSNTGNIEDLPFDINHNRITPYDPNNPNDKTRLSNIIIQNISSLLNQGKLYNPIEDHIKKKIDYLFLQIVGNIINIFDFEQNVNFSTRPDELSKLTKEELAELLVSSQTLGFYYLFNYSDAQQSLERILDQLLSCSYFTDSWRAIVIELIDWIDLWTHSIDPHFSPNLLKIKQESAYRIRNMKSVNPSNPENSVILLKHYIDNDYKVVQGGFLTQNNYETSTKIVALNKQYSEIIATRIHELFECFDKWLNESGNEIILDPHYYIIENNNKDART